MRQFNLWATNPEHNSAAPSPSLEASLHIVKLTPRWSRPADNLREIMPQFRILGILVAVCAQLVLSGCFVTSSQVPAGTGPINDEAIVGSWRGLNSASGEEEDAFIHIQSPVPDKPLRVVYIEKDDLKIYELHTTRVGDRNAFAAKVLEADDEADKREFKGDFLLGFYEIKGDELLFHFLDADKVSELIRSSKVKGKPGKGQFSSAKLTGTPAELARFLASPDGWASRMDEPARMRRLTKPD